MKLAAATTVIVPYRPRPLQRVLHKVLDRHRFVVAVCHRRFGSDEHRIDVREAIVAASREHFQSATALVAALDIPGAVEATRWALSLLIQPVDQDESPSVFRELSDWQWLGPVLVDAERQRPDVMLGQLARVVGTVRQVSRRRTFDQVYQLDRDRVVALFGNHMDEMLRVFADSAIPR